VGEAVVQLIGKQQHFHSQTTTNLLQLYKPLKDHIFTNIWESAIPAIGKFDICGVILDT
jgi:hypothetical protein